MELRAKMLFPMNFSLNVPYKNVGIRFSGVGDAKRRTYPCYLNAQLCAVNYFLLFQKEQYEREREKERERER